MTDPLSSDGDQAARCRLCGGITSKAFETTFLGRHRVAMLRCEQCNSLQSEQPYWLTEAYQAALAATDTGAVERNLKCHAAIIGIAKALKIRGRFLDFGGGTGLLCRLLRDHGYDAYAFDPYVDPVYARSFVMHPDTAQDIGLLSVIEVFEHCANPALDLAPLFAIRPNVLVATTVVYQGEGNDWWYLSAETGQHIFFYSARALRMLGERHGYDYYGRGSFHVFARERLSRWHKLRLHIALSRWRLRLRRAQLAIKKLGQYSDADSRDIQSSLRAKQGC